MRIYEGYVYMITNTYNNVLYTGVTNNLERRISEHQSGQFKGFTQKYRVHKLVYFERFADFRDAIAREKQLKGWTRAKKNALIETMNPEWKEIALR